MFLGVIRRIGKIRFTLGEMLVGVAILAICLAYWASEVQGFRPRTLSPPLQKQLPSNPSQALMMQKNIDARNSNALLAHKITAYAFTGFNALIFAVFLKIRRSMRGRGDNGDS
jgi:hypothetical protein